MTSNSSSQDRSKNSPLTRNPLESPLSVLPSFPATSMPTEARHNAQPREAISRNVMWTTIPLNTEKSGPSQTTTQAPDEILGGEWELEPAMLAEPNNVTEGPPQLQPIASCPPISFEHGIKEKHPQRGASRDANFCLVVDNGTKGDGVRTKSEEKPDTLLKGPNVLDETEGSKSRTTSTKDEGDINNDNIDQDHHPNILLEQQEAEIAETEKQVKELQAIFAEVAHLVVPNNYDICDFDRREDARQSDRSREFRKTARRCSSKSLVRWVRDWWVFLSTTKSIRILPGTTFRSDTIVTETKSPMETDRLLSHAGDRKEGDDVGKDEKFENPSIPGTFPQEPISEPSVKRVFSQRNTYLAKGRSSPVMNEEARKIRKIEIARKRITRIDENSKTITPDSEAKQDDEDMQAKEEKMRLSQQRLGDHFEEFEHDIFAQKSKMFLASIEVEGGEEEDEDDESVFEEAKQVQDPATITDAGDGIPEEKSSGRLEGRKLCAVTVAEWMAKGGKEFQNNSAEEERGRQESRLGALARATGEEGDWASCSLAPVSRNSKVSDEIVMNRARLDRIR